MIFNNTHKFIFVKVAKTGSSSLQKWFLQNFIFCKFAETSFHSTLQQGIDRNALVAYKHPLSETEIVSVIRNPLDRAISAYFFFYHDFSEKRPDHFRSLFKDGIYQMDSRFKDISAFVVQKFINESQTDYIKLNGVIANVPWVYEHLNEHLVQFLEKHNVTQRVPIGFIRSTQRPKTNTGIDDFFDSKLKQAFLEYHKEEYELYMNLKETKYT